MRDAISLKLERLKSMGYIGQCEGFSSWDQAIIEPYMAAMVDLAEDVQALVDTMCDKMKGGHEEN